MTVENDFLYLYILEKEEQKEEKNEEENKNSKNEKKNEKMKIEFKKNLKMWNYFWRKKIRFLIFR